MEIVSLTCSRRSFWGTTPVLNLIGWHKLHYNWVLESGLGPSPCNICNNPKVPQQAFQTHAWRLTGLCSQVWPGTSLSRVLWLHCVRPWNSSAPAYSARFSFLTRLAPVCSTLRHRVFPQVFRKLSMELPSVRMKDCLGQPHIEKKMWSYLTWRAIRASLVGETWR